MNDKNNIEVPLKEHFDDKFIELEKRLSEKQKYQEKALQTAKEELNRRLEGMNEFREQLQSQAVTFLTRERFDSQSEKHTAEHKTIDEKISRLLSSDLYHSEHKTLADKVEEISTWKSKQEGAQSFANIVSVIAVIISIFMGILHFIKP